MADIEAFIAAPSVEVLAKCTKDQLLKLEDHYSVVVGDKRKELKLKVSELGVMTSEPGGVLSAQAALASTISSQGLTFEQQKELPFLQMEHDPVKHEWELKVETICQQTERTKLDLETYQLSSGRVRLEQSGSSMQHFDINNFQRIRP